jgi:uncharacterized protein YjbI with pentapeptide repeats
MARKKTPPIPVSPIQGKTFWLDPAVQTKDLPRWIRGRGGVLVGGVTAALDFLVLATSRRSAPGQSRLEKQAARAGGAIRTIYEEDLPPLLLPTREEALAVLAGGAANDKVWDALLPPRDSPWRIDLSGADLRGLQLIDYGLRNCIFDGILVDGTNLDDSAIDHPKNVDFRGIHRPASMYISGPDRCNFAGMVLDDITITDPVACDFSDADLTGRVIHRAWETTALVAERANFTGVKMAESMLPRARLRGANFTTTDLTRAALTSADLREANLTGANLRGADLRKADLRQANLREANLGDADLTGAKLTGADFTGASLHRAKGVPATIAKKVRPGTTLLRLEAALMDADPGWQLHFALGLSPSGRVEVRLTGRKDEVGQIVWQERMESHSGAVNLFAALRNLAAEYAGAAPLFDAVRVTPEAVATRLGPLPVQAVGEVFGQPLATPEDAVAAGQAAEKRSGQARTDALAGLRQGAPGVARWNALDRLERDALGNLRSIDLSDCDLTSIDLSRTDCASANLKGADLSQATLVATDFRRANLAGAVLNQAKAHGVILTNANLEGAILRKGQFTYTRFLKANLRSADLTGADFKRASLKGADLTGAIVTNTNFDRAEYDAATVFPSGFNPRTAGMILRTPKAKKPAKPASPADQAFAAFLSKLRDVAVRERIKNAVSMLKAEKFSLFAETSDDRVIGVVRSQTSKERVYACRLTSAGQFECGTQNLRPCGGLQGRVCKHLLVLLLGLTRAGNADGTTLLQWLQLAQRQKPTFDKETMTATFLKYKGAEAGTVDWRPTETIPEDYYAL